MAGVKRLAIGWVLCWAGLVGLVEAAAPPLLNVTELPDEVAIAQQALWFEDTDKQLNLEKFQQQALGFNLKLDSDSNLVLSPGVSFELVWETMPYAAPNFSFSDSAYWMWFRLDNPDENLQKRVFQIAAPSQDYIDFYQINAADGTVVRSFKTGDRRAFDSRPVRSKDFVFPVDLLPGHQYEFLIRFDSHDGLYDALPMSLLEQKRFHEATTEKDLGYGAYYGALLSFLVFNLFLFLSTRERVFFYYSLYLAAFFVWNFTFRGWAYSYWWPDFPTWNNQFLLVSGSLVLIFMTWFSTEYMQTKRMMPWAHRLMWLLAAVTLISIGLGAFNYYALAYAVMMPFYIFTLLLMIYAGSYLMFKGQRAAKFFVLAWSVLLIGVVIYFLRVAGLMNSSLLTEYSLQVGSVLQFMLLAFGLADRINVLKSEKVALQQSALETEQLASSRLEVLVKRRTEQLERLNKRLAKQSITDSLTLLYNRRHFNEQLHEVINSRSCALLLIDVDQFKRYNDRYGHLAGDKVLVKIARTLQRLALRAGGDVYRVGGEEFACLLLSDHIDKAVPIAQTLCDEVAALAIEHQDSSDGVVTISVGLAWVDFQPGRNADEVYARADKALYEAKKLGRNQVQISV